MNTSPILRDRVLSRLLVSPTGCLMWTSSLNTRGYGHISFLGKTYRIHRLMYEWFTGSIPDGLQIDHLCRVRHCGAPDHLEAVTPRVNTLRGTSVTAVNAQKTHCIRGHLFEPSNIYIRSDGRECRECAIQRARRQHARERRERSVEDFVRLDVMHGGDS